MLKRPKPIKLSDEVREAIDMKLNTQVVQRVSKSLDPVNFPVFEIPTGKKVLIYVPNHTTVIDDVEVLRMDRPLIHPVKDGNSFLNYRCVSGLMANDEEGNVLFNGSCPLCDSTAPLWELANLKINQKCRQLHLDPNDKDNNQVKTIRSSEFSARILKESIRYYTFPIVVINTKNDDGKTPVTDETNQFVCTPMWYHVSEAQYNRSWATCLEGIEDEPTNPGGRFYTLNYSYDTKGKEANKRDSARNLTVIARNFKNSDKLKEALDDATAEWTPAKARETVVTNLLYSYEDLEAIAKELLSGPIDMINLLKASEESIPSGIEEGETGFKLSAPKQKSEEEQEALPVGDTDLDFDTDAD